MRDYHLGLQTNWPPPIGGYVVFNAQNREANIGSILNLK